MLSNGSAIGVDEDGTRPREDSTSSGPSMVLASGSMVQVNAFFANLGPHQHRRVIQERHLTAGQALRIEVARLIRVELLPALVVRGHEHSEALRPRIPGRAHCEPAHTHHRNPTSHLGPMHPIRKHPHEGRPLVPQGPTPSPHPATRPDVERAQPKERQPPVIGQRRVIVRAPQSPVVQTPTHQVEGRSAVQMPTEARPTTAVIGLSDYRIVPRWRGAHPARSGPGSPLQTPNGSSRTYTGTHSPCPGPPTSPRRTSSHRRPRVTHSTTASEPESREPRVRRTVRLEPASTGGLPGVDIQTHRPRREPQVQQPALTSLEAGHREDHRKESGNRHRNAGRGQVSHQFHPRFASRPVSR